MLRNIYQMLRRNTHRKGATSEPATENRDLTNTIEAIVTNGLGYGGVDPERVFRSQIPTYFKERGVDTDSELKVHLGIMEGKIDADRFKEDNDYAAGILQDLGYRFWGTFYLLTGESLRYTGPYAEYFRINERKKDSLERLAERERDFFAVESSEGSLVYAIFSLHEF